MREPEDIRTLLGCLIAPNSSSDKALISIDNFIVMSERNLNSSFICFKSKQWLLEQGEKKKKKIVLKNKNNKKNFYSSFSSKNPREPRLLGSYMEQGKLLIENTLFDKFYHCFNLQIIHKSTVTHSILFNLWNHIKLALFHRNSFQPPKKFPGDIYRIS